MHIRNWLVIGLGLVCAACAVTPTKLTTAATSGAATGAALATPGTLTAGQEFCAKATADGPLVAALINTAGVPVTVTGLASSVVASACQAWDKAAVPVSPPPASQPVAIVAIPTA